jgi:hypothetical protein
MSAQDFVRRAYKVKVKTTKPKYADKSEKPPVHRYSVVDHIVEPLTGRPAGSTLNF